VGKNGRSTMERASASAEGLHKLQKTRGKAVKKQKKSGLKKCFVCDRIFVKRNGQEKEDNTWKEKEN